MDNDDCDLFSIVRSCNATTFTTPTSIFETPPQIQTKNTNNIISSQNTTLSCFDDFTFTQENSSVPFAPLKPNDFIDLDKLMIKSNPITTIPTPSNTIVPTHITNINTSVHDSNQNSTFFDFPALIEQQHMQPSEFTELENFVLKFNPTTAIPTPTTIIPTLTITTPTTTTPTPTTITPITTTTTPTTPTTIVITSTATTHIIPTTTTTITNTSVHEINQCPTSYDLPILIEQQQIQPKNKNQVSIPKYVPCIEITTTHFEQAYNHPLVPEQSQTSSRVLPNTQPQKSNRESRKRKNNNRRSLVCYATADKLSEDSWAWRKYGQKAIKGSPHPRSYYRCSTFTDCLARKQVEKSKTKENIYIVTYKGEHNHKRPEVNKNFVVGTSQSKQSDTRLPTVREAISSPNVEKSGLPNVVMTRFDQPESSNAHVLVDQSKIPYPEKGLIESQLHATVEDGSSKNVGNLGSNNMMMLQFDEPESSSARVFPNDSKTPYSETRYIESSYDEDNILIPNITAMSEDFLVNFNHLNKGVLFP